MSRVLRCASLRHAVDINFNVNTKFNFNFNFKSSSISSNSIIIKNNNSNIIKSTSNFQSRVRNNKTKMPAVPTTSSVIPGAPVSIVLKADQRTGRQVQGLVRDVLTRGNHPRGIKVRLVDGRIGRVQGMGSSSSSSSSNISSSGAATSITSLAGGGGGKGGVETAEEEAQRQRQNEIPRDLATQERVRGPDRERWSSRGAATGGFQHKYTDVRLDDDVAQQPAEQQLDLMAFVRQPKQKNQKKNSKKTAGGSVVDAASSASETSSSPFASTVTATATNTSTKMMVPPWELQQKQQRQTQQPHSELFRALDVVHTESVKCPVCGVFEGDEAAVAHHVEGHFTQKVVMMLK